MGSPSAIIVMGSIVALAVVVWGAFQSRRSIAIAVVAVGGKSSLLWGALCFSEFLTCSTIGVHFDEYSGAGFK